MITAQAPPEPSELQASQDSEPLAWLPTGETLVQSILNEVEPLFNPLKSLNLCTEHVLPYLFKKDDLVCVGKDTCNPIVGPLSNILFSAHDHQFIVVNPMKDKFGINLQGNPSARCKDNVRLRRHIVAEFDDPRRSRYQQAQLATFLGRIVPLILAVDSGGKSVHAWFRVETMSARDQARFFMVACLLGADPNRWDICGWLRMPGGLRKNGTPKTTRQRILYFDPGAASV